MKTFLAFCLLLLVSAFTAAQQEQRFRVDTEDLSHPLTIKKLNRSGSHTVNISRRFANEGEEKLVRIAEAVYPARSEVTQKGDPVRKTGAGVNKDRLWWCNEFDGVLIPYAITKSAVAYYLEVSKEFGKRRPREPFWSNMKSSSLMYSASITRKESYQTGEVTRKDVYVVSMKLEWSQYCGKRCAMWFEKSRTIVLDEKGEVLAVEGDGCASARVS